MGIHSAPMKRDGPKLKALASSALTSVRAPIHSWAYPSQTTTRAWTTKNAANGSRVTGRCQSSQRASGSISGRGMSTASTRKAAVATRLPPRARNPATVTKVMRLPVCTSNQNG
jgi:hypothetical protein